MELKNIVAEYDSKNLLVKKLFLKRLEIAIQLALPILNKLNEPAIIDIGCGQGKLLKLLEKKNNNIKLTGIDIEPKVIELKNNIDAEIHIMSALNINLPKNSFDAAFCLDVLEHLRDQELQIATCEIKRILKPNGLLITSLPTENLFYKFNRLLLKGTTSAVKGPGDSPHLFNAKKIEKRLRISGFKQTEQKRLPSFPFLSLFRITAFTL